MKTSLLLFTILALSLVGAYYSGDNIVLDLSDRFTSITQVNVPDNFNYSLNNLILTIKVPDDFTGNFSFDVSGYNEERIVTRTVYSGGSIGSGTIYRDRIVNNTIIQLVNNTIEKPVYLTNSTEIGTDNISSSWILQTIIIIIIILIVALFYYFFLWSKG